MKSTVLTNHCLIINHSGIGFRENQNVWDEDFFTKVALQGLSRKLYEAGISSPDQVAYYAEQWAYYGFALHKEERIRWSRFDSDEC